MSKSSLVDMTEEQKDLFGALTPLQQKVSTYSLSGKSNIDSYKLGGGKAKKQETAECCASEILSNPKVKAFLECMRHEAVRGAVMTRLEMSERLSTLARVNMSDLIEWRKTTTLDAEGNQVEQAMWALKESSELDEYQLAAIAEVTAGREGFKIKQHSPLLAMKQLADVEGYNAAIKQDVKVTDVTPSERKNRIAELMERLVK